VVIIGIADDTYYIGGVMRALAARKLAEELAEQQLGLSSRPDKDAAVARDPAQLTQEHRAALAAAHVPLVDGIEVVGVPYGSAGFVSAKLDAVLAGIKAKADALVQTQKASPNTVQSLATSACFGLASMFNHLMRSLPPEKVIGHARQVDEISASCLRSVLGLTHVNLETAEGIEFKERLFLSEGGMQLQSCARAVDAAYIGHWARIGPTVQKMLPHLQLTDPATMSLQPLLALKTTAERVATAAEDEAIKRVVKDLPLMLSNAARGLQGVIGQHRSALALKRFQGSMPTTTPVELARKRAFISGTSTEAGAAVHVSRRSLQNQLSDDEYRVNCALRLGVDAFPPPLVAVKCPDCRQTLSESTSHGLCCASAKAQGKRTEAHTAMDVAHRVLIRELNADCVVTGPQDAYPADKGFRPSEAHPEARNHRADAYVFDFGTGTGHLIDYTFVNSMKSTGLDGAAPGGHADVAEEEKYVQYGSEFVGLNADSSPALVILAMERHGSFSKGTREYWRVAVQVAHERQRTAEFPIHISVMTRRVLQTLAVALWRVNASHILQYHRWAFDGARRVVGA
jgi:hypothetical protein